jgi:hypothetical protein
MGGVGGGGAKAKIKIEQGKQKKKFEHDKSLKKNSCRDFSIGKIISRSPTIFGKKIKFEQGIREKKN